MLSKTAQKAIDAYGGEELWRNAKKIIAEVSVRGLAFRLKRRPFFEKARIEMDVQRPFISIIPIGKQKDIYGVLDERMVQLQNAEGDVIMARENPRRFFPYGRRLFYWDDLDMAYFANYAFWNYFTLPCLLLNAKIKWIERKIGVLEAVFPESIPTHSKVQEFHFNQNTGLLYQHNYTAEVISQLATAAHVVIDHDKQDGLLYASKRIVTPRSKKGNALPWPILIDITVHGYQLY